MPPASSSATTSDDSSMRDRGDACPGALRLHSADDGALARVRIPAGILTGRQARALADAAERLGDGRLDITSRGNIQLRGLGDDCGGELAALLDGVGLLPAPRHERVRNIVASPLSGLDAAHLANGTGRTDVLPWAMSLDRFLCASETATALSGRFLFAFDDGHQDVAALGADVTVWARPDGQALIRIGDDPDALRIPAKDAARAALLAAEVFLAVSGNGGTRAWRVRELVDPDHLFALSASQFARRLAAAGITAEQHSAAPSGPTSMPQPGIVAGSDERSALSVVAPLGRLTSAQWRLLATVATQLGADELRVTPWRGVVLPGLPTAGAPGVLSELAEAGLITDTASPWWGVGACTGLPGCAKSLTDVRAEAAATAAAGHGGLPVYWSGCARRCGHPPGTAWVDVVAAASDGYDVFGPGATGRRSVPTAEIADAVAAARTPSAPSPQTASPAQTAPPAQR
ncbi:precorrin-3B synthase [Streptomyces sp. NPDC051320]|uniref:precorrin-3B synthase n=1 Tax=Streptomyces sp. NPDC051320 TaxID=3154644 RepID=UPI0034178D6F